MSQQQNNDMQQHFYRASAADFGKIPGSPVAYWLPSKAVNAFLSKRLDQVGKTRRGLQTGSKDRFIRYWYECDFKSSEMTYLARDEAIRSKAKWFMFNNGGDRRKWYGNLDLVVNWCDNGCEIKSFDGSIIPSEDLYFKRALCWPRITSGEITFRLHPQGIVPGDLSPCYYSDKTISELGYLNSKCFNYFLKAINPTVTSPVGDVAKVPVPKFDDKIERGIEISVNQLIEPHKNDWNSYETSWDFKNLPLLNSNNQKLTIDTSYQKLRKNWHETTLEMQRLEEENNRLFIEAYGLQDELTPEVPLSEITLTCNPHYRYGGNLTDDEREARLQSDTICELISYAIGCMMGRYSLDREGLVYAHAGNEGFKALVEEGAYATFAADEDGILPLSAESWFADDVAARFEAFVRTVWGAEQFEENLQFIADSLCLSAIKPVKKGGETSRETLRRYLTTQFYKDHLKTYKKRPIYWLFSSGKEKAFECLVYLHRYNEATLPRMRTEYVTPLLGQIASRIERKRMEQAEASTSDAKRISKEIDSLTKQLAELRAFDDQLKHHADMRISLDLDDGVKVNYGKFGTLLSDVKAISGDKGE